jgi:hypothetical protein
MNELSNWILSIIALVFLAPILNMAHQDLHTRFISTVSQFNPQLAQRAFISWQVVVSLIFALAVIGSYLALAREKYQLLIFFLAIGITPIVFTYKSASFYYVKEMELF